jgi:tRNA(Ile)-lysidine synthase
VNDLKSRFQQYACKYQLFTDVRYVVAAVSGGVDSMVMLQLLLDFPGKNFEVVVTHLNHRLRGADADRDEQLVFEYCQLKGINLYIHRVPITTYAIDSGISMEMVGRLLRYQFFREVACQFPQAMIATAHTLDDNSETLLLRIIKGTGIDGLAGIPVKSEELIRPMRFFSKAEIYTYAHEHQIPYREDISNLSSDYARNLIRNQLLPLIQSTLNPNVVNSLDRLSLIAAENTEYLDRQLQIYLPDILLRQSHREILLDLEKMLRLPEILQQALLRYCINLLDTSSSPPSYERLTAVQDLITRNVTGKYVELGNYIQASTDRGRLILFRQEMKDWSGLNIQPGQIYCTPGFCFRSEQQSTEVDIIDSDLGIEFIDLDKITENLKLRRWQRGDRIVPLGMHESKKISDLFVDLKIPRLRKNEVPLLVSGNQIIWVCGYKLSELFKVTASTKRILKCEFEEL